MTIDKEKMDEIFGGLKKDSVVGLLIQRSPDPDSLGSAAAFGILLKIIYKLESKIYHYGEISHPQNKSMKNILHISLNDGEEFDPDDVAATVILDADLASTGFKSEKLTRVDVRIDHHEMERGDDPRIKDVRPVGSTCSIVWEYLVEYGIDLKEYPSIATGLVLGIKTDTLDFTNNLTDLDMEAYRSLLPAVNKELLLRVTNFKLPKENFEYEIIAFNNKDIRATTLVTSIGELPIYSRDVISTIADKLIRMAGISNVIVLAIIDDHLQASVRSQDDRVDVKDLLVKTFGKDNSGSKENSGGARLSLIDHFKYISDKDVRAKVMDEIIFTFRNKIFLVLGENEEGA